MKPTDFLIATVFTILTLRWSCGLPTWLGLVGVQIFNSNSKLFLCITTHTYLQKSSPPSCPMLSIHLFCSCSSSGDDKHSACLRKATSFNSWKQYNGNAVNKFLDIYSSVPFLKKVFALFSGWNRKQVVMEVAMSTFFHQDVHVYWKSDIAKGSYDVNSFV